MVIFLIKIISLVAQLLSLALVAECFLSFFVAYNPYSKVTNFYYTLQRITNPVVSPFRNLLSRFNTGMFDFSPMLALIAIEIVAKFLIRILVIFAY